MALGEYQFTRNKRVNKTDVIILITHNQPEKSDKHLLIEQAKRARRQSKMVIVVGVSDDADHELMRNIVSRPFYLYYFAALNHTDLVKILEVMKEAYCPESIASPDIDTEGEIIPSISKKV